MSLAAPSPLPTVIILASGRGERFKASGGATHKLQALLGDKTVLQHTLDAVQGSGLPWHLEDAGHPGMGDSIAAGVAATPDACGWLILPADLPLVGASTLHAIAQGLAQSDVVVPVHAGRRGHPVAFGRKCRDDLLALHGPAGAAAVLKKHALQELAVDDVGICTDIDTLQDLAHAQALYQSMRSGGGAASAGG